MTTEQQPIEAPPTEGSARRRHLIEIVETLVLTVVIFFGIQTFVAQPFQIQQVSMEATLTPGQYVLIDKLTPRFGGFERGDIVVFEPPPSWTGPRGIPLIKRVIGLPGERIELLDGKVLVNGHVLDEPYVFAQDGVAQSTLPLTETSSWTLAPGELFVMGDHREDSQDSRAFGPIQASSALGRAVLRYWPADALELIHRPVYS